MLSETDRLFSLVNFINCQLTTVFMFGLSWSHAVVGTGT